MCTAFFCLKISKMYQNVLTDNSHSDIIAIERRCAL